MRGQRTVREQSENGQSIMWPFSQPAPLGMLTYQAKNIDVDEFAVIEQIFILFLSIEIFCVSWKKIRNVTCQNCINKSVVYIQNGGVCQRINNFSCFVALRHCNFRSTLLFNYFNLLLSPTLSKIRPSRTSKQMTTKF